MTKTTGSIKGSFSLLSATAVTAIVMRNLLRFWARNLLSRAKGRRFKIQMRNLNWLLKSTLIMAQNNRISLTLCQSTPVKADPRSLAFNSSIPWIVKTRTLMVTRPLVLTGMWPQKARSWSPTLTICKRSKSWKRSAVKSTSPLRQNWREPQARWKTSLRSRDWSSWTRSWRLRKTKS